MKNWYLLGLVAGFFVGAIALFCNRKKNVYDERQIAARGAAHAVGFWAMILSSLVLAFLDFGFGIKLFYDDSMALVVTSTVGIAAVAVTAIIKDAYFSLYEDKRRFFGIGIVCFILLLLCSIRFGMEGMLIEDGRLSSRSFVLFALALWTAIFLTFIIHGRKKGQEE